MIYQLPLPVLLFSDATQVILMKLKCTVPGSGEIATNRKLSSVISAQTRLVSRSVRPGFYFSIPLLVEEFFPKDPRSFLRLSRPRWPSVPSSEMSCPLFWQYYRHCQQNNTLWFCLLWFLSVLRCISKCIWLLFWVVCALVQIT